MLSRVPGLRSSAGPVGGLVYFARLLDEICLHRDGSLIDADAGRF